MKKSTYIRGKIEKEKMDFFCGTDTWHCQSDEPSLVRATPPDYDYVEDYNDNCYGSVVIFLRRSHNTYKLNLPQYNTQQCAIIWPHNQLESWAEHIISTDVTCSLNIDATASFLPMFVQYVYVYVCI